jgi:hypothetical protein
MNKFYLSKLALPALIFAFALTAFAQQGNVISLTADDYARAEKSMGYNTATLVDRGGVRPNWLPDDRFWYRVLTAQGSEFVLINAANGTRQPLFDHAKLAAAISAVAGTKYEATRLPIVSMNLAADEKSISFFSLKKNWKCDIQAYICVAEEPPKQTPTQPRPPEVFSPDGKKAAFIKDFNLWVRERVTGKETQLTTSFRHGNIRFRAIKS